jgi:ABC-type antimicrobial peptide transport system permease subunit
LHVYPQANGLFSTAAGLPAVIGLLLAFAGVYGVVAFVMTQRTREFGIRMALGATAGRIMRSVVGHAIRTATLAAAVGLLGTAGAMRGIAAISGLRPVISPSIYTAAAVIVVVAAAVASLIPARRACSIRRRRCGPSSRGGSLCRWPVHRPNRLVKA